MSNFVNQNTLNRKYSSSPSNPRSHQDPEKSEDYVKLYISNLGSFITYTDVKKAFEEYGVVLDVVLKKKHENNYFFGFVTMKNRRDAENAEIGISQKLGWKVNFYKKDNNHNNPGSFNNNFNNRSRSRSISQQRNHRPQGTFHQDRLRGENFPQYNRNFYSNNNLDNDGKAIRIRELWVGNLPHSMNEAGVYNHFFVFGEISKIEHYKEKGFAFIKYRLEQSAAKAYETMRNSDVGGRTVKISFSDSIKRKDVIGDEDGYELNESTCKLLHCTLTRNYNIPDSVFIDYFTKFGNIKAFATRNSQSKQSMFIEYYTAMDAKNAFEYYNYPDLKLADRKKQFGDINMDLDYYYRKKFDKPLIHPSNSNYNPSIQSSTGYNNPIYGSSMPPNNMYQHQQNPGHLGPNNNMQYIPPHMQNPNPPYYNQQMYNQQQKMMIPRQGPQSIPSSYHQPPYQGINHSNPNYNNHQGIIQQQHQPQPPYIQQVNPSQIISNPIQSMPPSMNPQNSNISQMISKTPLPSLTQDQNSNQMQLSDSSVVGYPSKEQDQLSTQQNQKQPNLTINMYGMHSNITEVIKKKIIEETNSNAEKTSDFGDTLSQTTLFMKDFSLEEENLKHIWSGFFTRTAKFRVGVDIYQIRYECTSYFGDYNYNISHRINFDDVLKKPICGVVVISPQNETQISMFEEYIDYFNEKQKAGVVTMKHNLSMYVIPQSDLSRRFYLNPKKHMLGIIICNTEEVNENINIPPPVISFQEKKKHSKKKPAAIDLENLSTNEANNTSNMENFKDLISNPEFIELLKNPKIHNFWKTMNTGNK